MLGAALSLNRCERDSAVRERKAPAVVRLHRRVLRDRDTIPLTGRGSPPGEPFDIETSPSGHFRATWRCHLLAEPRVPAATTEGGPDGAQSKFVWCRACWP